MPAWAEEGAYGSWNKVGLANAQLARLVLDAVRQGAFPLILESNCYAAIGVLAGLQKSAQTARTELTAAMKIVVAYPKVAAFELPTLIRSAT
jgi:hypothetical protein